MSEVAGKSVVKHRGATAVSVVAAVVAAVSLGALLVVTSGARTVAVTSQALEWSNAVSAASAATRAANSQALVFAVDFDLGVASPQARSVALTEARSSLAALESAAASPPGGAQQESVLIAVRDLQVAAADTIEALERANLFEADRLHSEVFAQAYQDTSAALFVQQAAFATAVLDADGVAARFESVTQLLITLLIPVGAVLAYRRVVARQQRERKIIFEARLSAEKRYSRSKDEFFDGISHELRTPLTAIYGLSEHLVEHGLGDIGEAEELIALIHRDSAELFRMVEDLLMAARLDDGLFKVDLASVDVRAVFDGVAGSLRRSGVTVSVEGTASAHAEHRFLTHVARNLLSNASTYGGGEVLVKIKEHASTVRITVADDGPGVDPATVDTLFAPLVHDGSEVLLVGSVGLGLAVARLLIEVMGGTIQYSRIDGWTVFTATLQADGSDAAVKSIAMPSDPFAPAPSPESGTAPPGQIAMGA